MIAPAIALLTMMSVIFTMTGCSFGSDPSGKIDRVISKMSMDEKISQMIIPAIRTWIHYTDEMKDKIAEADTVIAFSYAAGSGVLDKENPQLIALQEALADTHKAGGRFVLISENLPYDAAIYKDADAVILGYMGAGLGMDPMEKTDSGSGMPARNANVNAAIRTVFGAEKPLGHLPVNIPVVEEQADGSLAYGSSYLYERGFGLTY